MSPIPLCPVVLAGGSGTRLWPWSREGHPKQLLKLTGERTLLQETLARLEGFADETVAAGPPLVVCNERYRFLVAEQIEAMGLEPAGLLLEPAGRNTAPALTLAALEAARADRDAVLLVMPADHVIQDRAAFQAAVATGARLAGERRAIGTFGIVPTHPETGFGYIRKGPALAERAFVVEAFVEKPDRATALDYLESGAYLWNGGLFLVRASVWLEAAGRYCPAIAEGSRRAHAGAARDGTLVLLDRAAFEACPSDSIDYAVMEPLTAERAAAGLEAFVIPLDAGWSDIGSWSAVMGLRAPDAGGNVTYGDVHAHDTKRCLLASGGRLVAAVGLEDAAVVETADAVLVAPLDRAQDVKQVVEWLKRSGRPEAERHPRTHHPWGHADRLLAEPGVEVNRLVLRPGAALTPALEPTARRQWTVVRGEARMTRDPETGAVTHIANPTSEPLELVEVRTAG